MDQVDEMDQKRVTDMCLEMLQRPSSRLKIWFAEHPVCMTLLVLLVMCSILRTMRRLKQGRRP